MIAEQAPQQQAVFAIVIDDEKMRELGLGRCGHRLFGQHIVGNLLLDGHRFWTCREMGYLITWIGAARKWLLRERTRTRPVAVAGWRYR